MKLSFIIPVFNKWDLTSHCLLSLAKTLTIDAEVIVVDNASSDDTYIACPALGRKLFAENFIYLRQEKNLNFAPACNIGARKAKGEFLFFLNNDTVMTEGWLEPLLEAIALPPYPTMVSPMLLYPIFAGKPDRVQHLGIAFEPQYYPTHLYEGFPADHPVCKKRRAFQALTAAAVLISRKTFIQEGFFDEEFINGGEDVEMGVRLRSRGHILTCLPQSKIYHLASQTPGRNDQERHNGQVLKAKALAKIIPDLHLFAEEDGYQLALTPGLKVYLEPPERRQKILSCRVKSLGSAQDLESLLEIEPLCHSAYVKLADMYIASKKLQLAANTLFLAVKMCPHPDIANRLLHISKSINDKSLWTYAKGVTAWYESESFLETFDTAKSMATFFTELNLPGLRFIYEQWLSQAEYMSSFFGAVNKSRN